MTTLHIDFETRSTVDLKTAGVDNYSKHSDTDVWCMAYAFDDDPVRVWTREHFSPVTDLFEEDVLAYVEKGGVVVAHNAAFELAIWNHIMVPRYGWPPLKPEQVRCTMAMAYAMALPGSLEKAAPAAGISEVKDAAGGRLMKQLMLPRAVAPDATITWWDEPEKLERLYEYCRQDVRVERELEKRLMPLSDAEQKLWVLDQRINNRGVYVDREAVAAAIAVVQAEQDRLNQEMRRVTGNFVGFCTETARLTQWLRTQGVAVEGVAKADVLDALDGDLPDAARAALLLRQEAGKSSTAKLRAMLSAVSSDGRLRGMLQYHGAATGRWAGRRVQLQNLPRPKLTQDEIEHAIEVLVTNPPERAAQILRIFYGSPLDVISSCLRGMLMAAPGNVLLAADFSAIEARGLAWLAGQEDVLDIFRGHGKIYEHAAAGIYRKPMAEVTKDERQIGKVAVLALGYGGGVGAFQTMARGYGVEVGDERADEIKVAWREAHPAIVRYWYALEDAAIGAVLHPGAVTTAGPAGRQVKFRVKGSFLWCLLPSGRALCYPYPTIKPRETPWGATKDALHYMAVDSVTNKWGETHTYGGSLAENVTQAVCRDVLAAAIVRCEAAGFPVTMHIHDEAVAEVPEGSGRLDEFEERVAEVPDWAEGFPISAEGWAGKRYRK